MFEYSLRTTLIFIAVSYTIILLCITQECEYCRLNSECFLNETETKKCQEFCSPEYMPNTTQYTRAYYKDSGLRSYHLLNYYGQISFSQLIGSSVCHSMYKLDYLMQIEPDLNFHCFMLCRWRRVHCWPVMAW